MSTTTFLQKYRVLSKVGEGSFSEVLKCQDRITGLLYAAKRLKAVQRSMEEALSSREVKCLLKLQNHPNILHMVDKHVDPLPGKLTLIFELMDMSLYDLIRGRKRSLPESRVKTYIYQVLKGLGHLHKNGLFHRDIKPENILLKNDVVKIADLGSVKKIGLSKLHTEYISTRWYRSPECLLTKGSYGPKMDIWATGCVNYELITLRPLFPGSSEVDMIHKIHTIIGTPTSRTVAKFRRMNERNFEYLFPTRSGSGINGLLPNVSEGGRDLLKQMLAYDPDIRAHTHRLLEHRYFNDLREYEESSQRRSRTLSRARAPPTKPAEWQKPLMLSYLSTANTKRSKRTATVSQRATQQSTLQNSKLLSGVSTAFLGPVQAKVPSHIIKKTSMSQKQLERTWGTHGANLPSTGTEEVANKKVSPSKPVQQTKPPIRLPPVRAPATRTQLSEQTAQKRPGIPHHYEKQPHTSRVLPHSLSNVKTLKEHLPELSRDKPSGRTVTMSNGRILVKMAKVQQPSEKLVVKLDRKGNRTVEVVNRNIRPPVAPKIMKQERRQSVIVKDSPREHRLAIDLANERRLAELAKDLPQEKRSSKLGNDSSKELPKEKDSPRMEHLSDFIKTIPKTGLNKPPEKIITSPRVLMESLPQTGSIRMPRLRMKSTDESGKNKFKSPIPPYMHQLELPKPNVGPPLSGATLETSKETLHQRPREVKSRDR